MIRSIQTVITLAALLLLPLASDAAPPDGLKKHKPVKCSKNRDIVLKKRHIKTPGTAVTVVGNCDVLIQDSRIEAGKHGIFVKGNGDVRLVNSHITGKASAITVTGNSDVYLKDTNFNGAVKIKGNADLHDGGGNRCEGHHPAGSGDNLQDCRWSGAKSNTNKKEGAPAEAAKEAPAKKPAIKAHKPVRCVGTGKITLLNRHIKTDGDGVALVGSCTAVIQGSRIEAGKYGVKVTGSGKILVEDSVISGAKGSVMITGSGVVTASGSTFNGKVMRTGTAKLVDRGGNSFNK